MFGHAETLEASGGEMIPGRSGEYIILQDRRLIEKARTYDEATRKGKVVKRRSYRQILVTAGLVRRRRLWADGRSAWR